MFEGLRKVAKGESNIDFIGRWKLWFILSGVVLLACVLGFVVRGGFELGLEFKGGTSFTVPLSGDVSVARIRDALEPFDLSEAAVQIATERGTGVRRAEVRTEHLDDTTQVQAALARTAGQLNEQGQPDVNAVSVNSVGPNWGRQVSNKALRGLIVFLVLVVIYISFRFEPKMAAAAVIALFHDLAVTAGVYVILGFTVTPATVIALLTLLGYSLYDTVVVFDRVRENAEAVGASTRTTYSAMVNRSLNQVLMRSLNTSLSSLLPVGALLFVGSYLLRAETLNDLSLALFVGVLVGSYSSVFLAPQILALWKEREPKYQQLRTRAVGGRIHTPAVATAGATASPDGGEEADARPAPRTQIRTARRPQASRGRKRRGGKRRR